MAVKLRDLLEVQNGFAFKTEFFSASEGIPLIRIRDLGSSTIETRYRGDYRAEFLVEPGDLLIGMDGNFTCRRWAGSAALLNQRVCRLRKFSSQTLPEYVFYGIQPRLSAIESTTSFSTVKHISARQILDIELPLLSLDEQRRIVDLLSRAEGIVRLRRQAQQKAAELIPAIFIDMFGDPTTNLKGWPRLTLGELIATGPTNGLYKHKSAYGAGTPILRIDAFYDGCITDLASLKRLKIEPDEQRRFALAAGDIIVNRVNSPEYLGKSALVPELLEPTVFESNMMRFSIDDQLALPEFVIALLQDPSSRRHFLANAKHAINQSSINQQDVKSLPVIAPPLHLQREFARRVAAVLAIEQQQQAAMAKAEATFDSLLARAFTDAGQQVHREMEKALA